MFYLDFTYDTFSLPYLPLEPIWYDPLREEGINHKEFEEQQEIFKLFHCRNRLDFIVVYAIDDVLHLADIWRGYVELLLEKFHLDLGKFVSLPSFSYSALMLHMYPQTIPNVPNIELFDAIHEHLEGGLSQTCNILSRSNDPRMQDFDRNCPVSNIYKVDENSLYASAMCMKLPIGEWEEINPSCKSLADWIELLRTIEDDLNSNLSLDEKYAMVDGNEAEMETRKHCYIIWATLDCSKPEYIKKWNEMSLCPIGKKPKSSQTEISQLL